MNKKISAAMLAASAVLLLAACTNSGTPQTQLPSVSPPPTSSGPLQVLPPIMVNSTTKNVSAKLGDTVVFAVEDYEKSSISFSNTNVLSPIIPGGQKNGVTSNPSSTAVGRGSVTVTVENPGQPPYIAKVTVK